MNSGMIEWREANEQGEHLIQGKECDQTEKLELSAPEKERDEECQTKENSPVETIEERLKRLRTNEIEAQIEAQTPGRRGWGGKKQKQLGRGNDEYLEEKTPVERMQMLRTSRMDTLLRTPAPRRKKGVGGWEKKTTED